MSGDIPNLPQPTLESLTNVAEEVHREASTTYQIALRAFAEINDPLLTSSFESRFSVFSHIMNWARTDIEALTKSLDALKIAVDSRVRNGSDQADLQRLTVQLRLREWQPLASVMDRAISNCQPSIKAMESEGAHLAEARLASASGGEVVKDNICLG